MAAPDDLLYEYAVIRYVPRIDREEFINIGLIMMNKRHRWLKALVLIDEDRLKALYAGADTECLRRQSTLFEMHDVPGKDMPAEEKYRWLTAVKSACLQVSPSHPGILMPSPTYGQDPEFSHPEIEKMMEDEFNRLFSHLVL